MQCITHAISLSDHDGKHLASRDQRGYTWLRTYIALSLTDSSDIGPDVFADALVNRLMRRVHSVLAWKSTNTGIRLCSCLLSMS